MTAFIDALCMAVGFLTMWRERWLPRPLTPEDWQPDPERTWFHNRKDRMCARIRKDVQWWTKFFCFALLVAVLT